MLLGTKVDLVGLVMGHIGLGDGIIGAPAHPGKAHCHGA